MIMRFSRDPVASEVSFRVGQDLAVLYSVSEPAQGELIEPFLDTLFFEKQIRVTKSLSAAQSYTSSWTPVSFPGLARGNGSEWRQNGKGGGACHCN